MRRTRLLWALAAVIAVGVAAGILLRGESTVSVEAALDAARSQDFDAVIWRASPAMREEAEEVAENTGQGPLTISGDGRIVIVRGRAITDLKQPLAIVWYPSGEEAEQRLEADRPLLEGRLSADERAALPADYDFRRLFEERVCNLVVWSYDDGSDGGLGRRVEAVVADLRGRC